MEIRCRISFFLLELERGIEPMHLYLVQHGAAKPESEDPERGLTQSGKRSVEKMAAWMVAAGVSVDRIEHSDKLRARQTAEILAVRLNPSEGTRQVAGLAPNDDVGRVLSRLREETKNLMLVGHLPHLGRLVARLVGLSADRTVVQFQMGGTVRIDRNETGNWVIQWAVTPELLLPP
jgi:phosphohistidine phosphatase